MVVDSSQYNDEPWDIHNSYKNILSLISFGIVNIQTLLVPKKLGNKYVTHSPYYESGELNKAAFNKVLIS